MATKSSIIVNSCHLFLLPHQITSFCFFSQAMLKRGKLSKSWENWVKMVKFKKLNFLASNPLMESICPEYVYWNKYTFIFPTLTLPAFLFEDIFQRGLAYMSCNSIDYFFFFCIQGKHWGISARGSSRWEFYFFPFTGRHRRSFVLQNWCQTAQVR